MSFQEAKKIATIDAKFGLHPGNPGSMQDTGTGAFLVIWATVLGAPPIAFLAVPVIRRAWPYANLPIIIAAIAIPMLRDRLERIAAELHQCLGKCRLSGHLLSRVLLSSCLVLADFA
jgi:hypothetical protein